MSSETGRRIPPWFLKLEVAFFPSPCLVRGRMNHVVLNTRGVSCPTAPRIPLPGFAQPEGGAADLRQVFN
jgi:hypothetical protein